MTANRLSAFLPRDDGDGDPIASDSELALALETYLAAVEAGQPVDLDRLAARHPEIADQLRACLGVLQLAGQVEGGSEGDAHPELKLSGDGHTPVRLGDFRLIRPVGRGGMGVVYEAEQVSLHRRVALKLLPFAAALDAQQLQRFETEAQAAARLHHTNIVPVFAVGSERGVHYYAMQFIDGQTLAALIRDLRRMEGLEVGSQAEPTGTTLSLAHDIVSGRLAPTPPPPPPPTPSPLTSDSELDSAQSRPMAQAGSTASTRSAAFFRTVAHLGIQAAEGLDSAHRAGIIHRDIKPANLLVDIQGNLWITDFGLARMQADAGLTMTGDILGTLRYMSPEQALARRGTVDHRTDIYSLGATLYELLTLRPALKGEDRHEILRKIADEEPARPRLRNPAIPRDLETIVLKAMSRDVSHRYATARELADDLRRFLDHRPIQARRQSVWKRAEKWARRHKAAVISGALVVITAAFSLGILHNQSRAWRGYEERMRQVIADQSNATTLARREMLRTRYANEVRLAFQLVRSNRLLEARSILQSLAPREGEEDLRSFPWYYLWKTCSVGARTWPGHSGSAHSKVYHVEYSPRGDLIASCGMDGTARLWDARTGRLVRTLRGHAGDVNWVSFAPDGLKVATGGDDLTVRVWDLAQDSIPPLVLGQEVRTPQGEQWITCVLFSKDGSRIIASALDGRLRLWDALTGRPLNLPPTVSGRIEGIALSGGGNLLAVGARGSNVRLLDAGTFDPRVELQDSATIEAVSFDHSGSRLASAGNDGRVRIWDTATGLLVRTLNNGGLSVHDVAFSPDDRTLAASVAYGTIVLWDLESGVQRDVIRQETQRLWCVGFCPDGRTLFSSGDDGTIQFWDLACHFDHFEVSLDMPALQDFCLPQAFSTVVIAGSGLQGRDGDRRVAVETRDLHTGAQLATQEIVTPAKLLRAVLCPDGERLATFESGGAVRVWSLASGENEQTLKGRPGWFPGQLAFHGDSLFIQGAQASTPEALVWNVRRNICRREGLGVYGRPCPVGPDTFLFCTGDTRIVRWDAATDAVSIVGPVPPGQRSLATSADGRLLALADGSCGIQLIDSRSLEPKAMLLGHSRWLWGVAFSPDGNVLASLDQGHILKLWDVATGQELITLADLDPDNRWQRIQFSPDGSALVCVGTEGNRTTIAIWPAAGTP